MKTQLNEKEIILIRDGRKLLAIKSFKERKLKSLREAKKACDEVYYALQCKERIIIEVSTDLVLKCLCGGYARLSGRNKADKRYIQVCCNRCGRRGAVFSYPKKWKTYKKYDEGWKKERKAIWEKERKAIYDWNVLMSRE